MPFRLLASCENLFRLPSPYAQSPPAVPSLTPPVALLVKTKKLVFFWSQGLKELNELVASYQGLRDNGARGPSIVSAAIASARTCNLDKDIKDLPSDETDTKLMTIEVGIGLRVSYVCTHV